jgi:hypothetical protein
MAARQALSPDSAKDALHSYLTGEVKNGGAEHVGYCPVCEDPEESKTPSASFNFEKMVWACRGKCSLHSDGSAGGSMASLFKMLKTQTGFNYRAEMMRGRNARAGSPLSAVNEERKSGNSSRVTQPYVDSWARKLWASTTALEDLTSQRGLNEDTIRRFEIGWDGSRYTLPVRDADGVLVNIRRYKINATRDKMLNIQNHGGVRLFNEQALDKNLTIVLCEGEMDCLMLEQNSIPATTATAGAATFTDEMAKKFQDKIVYVCYDADDTGNQGAAKAGKMVAVYAREVYKVDIPLPTKGADVTDYLFKEGHSAKDFKKLMSNATPISAYKKMVAEEAPQEGTPVSLEGSMAEIYQDETLEITGTVAGKQNPPFKVPKRFNVSCSMNKGPVCQQCPVFFRDGDMTVEIGQDDTTLFKFLDVNDEKFPKVMKQISGAMCTDRASFEVFESFYLEELVVGNSVDAREAGLDQKPVTRQMFSVSTHATEVNAVVRLIGKNVANPRNQRLSFMAWKNDPVRTSLDTFTLDDETRKELAGAFTVRTNDPDRLQSPLDKCFDIADEVAQHVTRIYGRDLLHVAYDLVWHSPLSFEVEGRVVEKGWLEAMVVGDTRTGKSETAKELSRHYTAGIVKSCEGATFAGLVGGVQQMGSGNWITTWGVIPLNDRRLVVLDEVSGLKDKDVIENMSSIRSSGLAQIVKIDTQETSARTRLLWITNPADGAMIDERPGLGVDAMRTVVRNQEDIARFDFVLAARASEVDPSTINQSHWARGELKYTKDLCSKLVLWAWSLKPEQIKFTDSAVAAAREIAQDIGGQYVPDPPLLQAENARFKLYRIAAAIAARTFHIEWPEKDRLQLTVNADHVRDAKRFLDLIYGNSGGMGYMQASRRIIDAHERAKGNRANALNYLMQNEDTVWATLKASQTGDGKFRQRDFEEFGGMSRDAALKAVGDLQRFGMIHRRSQGYITMDKQLVSVLRELEERGF